MNSSNQPEPDVSEKAGTVDQPEITVVLPAHNEADLLTSTVTTIADGLLERDRSFEIIVVENGSTDATLQLARALGRENSAVTTLTLPTGNYGAALRAGFEAARGNVVILFDVDYYDLEFMDESLCLLDEQFDLVLASKRATGAEDRRPWLRRILTSGFAAVLHAMFKLQVSDAHGMKAMRRKTLRPIVEQCKMSGSLFDVEMVLLALQQGLAVRELPVTVVERRPPRTSVLARTLETAVGIARLKFSLRHEQGRTGLK